jgi:hypothetical protein
MQRNPLFSLLHSHTTHTDALQEWRSVIQEVTNFLHADVAMPVPRCPGSNVPFRHSLRAALNQAEVKSSPHKMLLHDAILVSYYTRQVRRCIGLSVSSAHGMPQYAVFHIH